MKNRKNKKHIVNTILVFLILSITLFFLLEIYKEEKIKTKEMSKNKQYYGERLENDIQEENNAGEKNNIQKGNQGEAQKEYPKEEIIREYNGYPVIAKLEIPKIELETYILESYSETALNISVTKLWGANPNEVGNFCVVGHNFIRKNMFHNLKNLNIGDRFTISDNRVGIVEYEIYDLYKVLPEDVSVLSQETKEKQVTLITCTNDSKKRIIVKAREV